MQEVPRTPTPVPFARLRPLIEAAFRALGRELTGVEAVNLTALVAVETARGKAVQNGNLGNISAGAKYPGRVWRPPWFADAKHPLHQPMLDGKVPVAFRAYDSSEDGALDFAKLLLSTSYAPLMRAAASSDANAFRVALSERYSPDYANSRATETFRQLQRELGLVVSDTAPVALAGLLPLALLWMFLRRRP